MRQIPVGAKGSFSLLVQPEHLADRFKDATLPPVLATPVMIMVMENAALNAIRAYLDPGESAVGTAVNVRHLAATPVGRLVGGEAEVTQVDGRQIEFVVRATEGDKEIGVGTHSRVVIGEELNRKRLLQAQLFVLAASSAVLCALAFSGQILVWHVALGGLVAGIVWAMELAVRRRMLGEVVMPEQIGPAVAFDSLTN